MGVGEEIIDKELKDTISYNTEKVSKDHSPKPQEQPVGIRHDCLWEEFY